METDKLYTQIEKIRKDIGTAIQDLDVLSKTAATITGKISQVIPVNARASMEALNAVISGGGQNSLDALKEFLDTIPLGELHQEPVIDTSVSLPAGQTAPVNTAPNIAGTPGSSILSAAKESLIGMYMKDSAGARARMSEAQDGFSLRGILSDPEMAEMVGNDTVFCNLEENARSGAATGNSMREDAAYQKLFEMQKMQEDAHKIDSVAAPDSGESLMAFGKRMQANESGQTVRDAIKSALDTESFSN